MKLKRAQKGSTVFIEGDDRIYKETEILIRGKTTWNNAAPLILVDGVERNMNDIDINAVESISVLKDASATAVFGVKGGNGVILITTKTGNFPEDCRSNSLASMV